MLLAVGLILGLVAAVLFYRSWSGGPLSPPSDSQSQTGQPSAVKPSKQSIASYQVAPTLPKYIALPSIGVENTRVFQLGLEKDDQIATPNNIFDAGWYDASSKPGQPGAMFIYGHVSSWQADGIFYNLKKLKPGDKVIVTRGDNKTYTYQVNSSKIYPHDKVDMKAVLAPIDSSKPGLNLMTCTGQVIKGTSEFNERLVVFTSLVSS